MTSDRKKPTTGFWITVALVAVLGYFASIGPAYWACSDERGRIREDWSGWVFLRAYRPVTFFFGDGAPEATSTAIGWYLGLWGMP